MTGQHNLRNLAAAIEVLAGLGLGADEIARGLESFAGVRRRQEIRGVVGGVTVIDDFAHHPTAVRETLKALRERFPGSRLLAVFEPRTNTSRRALFQQAYAEALALADGVVVSAVDHPERAPADDRFDPAALVASLAQAGIPASYTPEVAAIVADLAAGCQPGDVIAVMSNGAFGGLHERLLEALAGAPRPAPAPPRPDGSPTIPPG
jgi:UDP-N-acetylmuramate: L-alanyl-gamma-D-glutamyl-meso-diaminopimelate ligase